jgi:hypothetical protein
MTPQAFSHQLQSLHPGIGKDDQKAPQKAQEFNLKP